MSSTDDEPDVEVVVCDDPDKPREAAEPRDKPLSEPRDKPLSEPLPLNIDTRPTVRLDAKDVKPSWPMALATLEGLGEWTVYALRLGTIAMIQKYLDELAQPHAKPDTVVKLRTLIEALAHMPMDI